MRWPLGTRERDTKKRARQENAMKIVREGAGQDGQYMLTYGRKPGNLPPHLLVPGTKMTDSKKTHNERCRSFLCQLPTTQIFSTTMRMHAHWTLN